MLQRAHSSVPFAKTHAGSLRSTDFREVGLPKLCYGRDTEPNPVRCHR